MKQKPLIKRIHTQTWISLLTLLIVLPVVIFRLLHPSTPSAAWFDETWKYREKITIDHTKVSGSANLTNYPMLLSITDTNLSAKALSTGNDILFTDINGKKLDHEIELYTSGTGVLIAWIRIPTLSYQNDTVLYMYYGNPSASSQENKQGVWAANFQGVWHMSEASGSRIDSSPNANNLTDVNTVTSASTKIGTEAVFTKANSEQLTRTDATQKNLGLAGSFTMSFWAKVANVGLENGILSKVNSTGYPRIEMKYGWDAVNSRASWLTKWKDASANTTTDSYSGTGQTNGTWYMVSIIYDQANNQITYCQNGTCDSPVSHTITLTQNDGTFRIGYAENDLDYYGGSLDEFWVQDNVQTTDWIKTRYNNQNSPSTFAAVGTQEQSLGPIAYWKFDEGVDNTCSGGTNDVCDSSGNTSFDGANTNAVWKTEEMCFSGKCLNFNGSSAYTTSGTGSSLSPTTITTSMWIKPLALPTSGNVIGLIDKRDDTGATAGWVLELYNNSGTQTITAGVVNSLGSINYTLPLNQWTHLTWTHTGTTDTVYINGNSVGTASSATITDYNVGLRIGARQDGKYFNGFIDEVKIYNYVRTQTQINSDYVRYTGTKGAGISIGAPSNKYLSDGLVGYWKLNENTGTSTTDYSGNGLTGTYTNTPGWATGKFGAGSTFSNSTNYISIGDQSSLELTTFTISGWFYRTGTCGTFEYCSIVSKGKDNTIGYNVAFVNNGGYKARLTLNDTQRIEGTTSISTNTWYFVTASIDGITARIYVNGVLENEVAQTQVPIYSTEVFKIGNSNFNNDLPGEGTIDDVRVYNRVLSPGEVRQLYNWAPGPIGYWPLDEGAGTTAFNRGSVANNGSLINSPSWSVGMYGSAITTSTANGVRVTDPADGSLDFSATDSFTYSAWVKTSSALSDEIIWKGYAVATTAGYRMRYTSNSFPACDITDATTEILAADNLSIADGKWHFISCVRIGGSGTKSINTYVDGILKKTTTDTSTNTLANAGNLEFNRVAADVPGSVDEVKIYNYARSQSQIIEDMNGGHPIGGSPVGSQIIYWKMDEQNGNTINDSASQTSENGTNSGAAWLTNTSCKVNGCLNFDTTTDNVTAGDLAMIDGLTGFTASMWLNPQTLATNKMIVSKANNITQRVFQIKTDDTTAAKLKVMVSSSASDVSNYCVTANSVLNASTWQYVAVVYNGTQATGNDQRIKVYVNGALASCTVTGTIPTSLVSATTSAFKLGQGDDTTPTALISYIDEFKFYNAPLTIDELLVDYNFGGSFNAAVGQNEAASLTDGAGNPPQIWWKLDENTGTSSVVDSSGNGNTGTMSGFSATDWIPGKVGQALNFDGSNNTITKADNAIFTPSAFTYSLWVKFNSLSTNQTVFEHDHSTGSFRAYNLYYQNSDNTLYFFVYSSACALATNGNLSMTGLITAGTWNYITWTWDGSTVSTYLNGKFNGSKALASLCNGDGSFSLGAGDGGIGNFVNGSIDDFKFYNYARTPAQIAYDYNRGLPVVKWNMDECQGSTVNDASGNGYNGTITIGASGTQTVLGSCTIASSAWGNGSAGKINSSVNFDGTDDYITTANISPLATAALQTISKVSWGGWFYPTTSAASKTLLEKATEFRITTDASSNAVCGIYYSSAFHDASSVTAPLTLSAWNHVMCVYDGTNLNTYVNGVLKNQTSYSTAITAASSILYVAENSSAAQRYSGQIDNVSIYSYALSATQIQQILNNGSVFFGPTSGTPAP